MEFEPLTFFVHQLPLKISAATLSHFATTNLLITPHSACDLDFVSEIEITDIKISIMDRWVQLKTVTQ
jgi:hypothetical protein